MDDSKKKPYEKPSIKSKSLLEPLTVTPFRELSLPLIRWVGAMSAVSVNLGYKKAKREIEMGKSKRADILRDFYLELERNGGLPPHMREGRIESLPIPSTDELLQKQRELLLQKMIERKEAESRSMDEVPVEPAGEQDASPEERCNEDMDTNTQPDLSEVEKEDSKQEEEAHIFLPFSISAFQFGEEIRASVKKLMTGHALDSDETQGLIPLIPAMWQQICTAQQELFEYSKALSAEKSKDRKRDALDANAEMLKERLKITSEALERTHAQLHDAFIQLEKAREQNKIHEQFRSEVPLHVSSIKEHERNFYSEQMEKLKDQHAKELIQERETYMRHVEYERNSFEQSLQKLSDRYDSIIAKLTESIKATQATTQVADSPSLDFYKEVKRLEEALKERDERIQRLKDKANEVEEKVRKEFDGWVTPQDFKFQKMQTDRVIGQRDKLQNDLHLLTLKEKGHEEEIAKLRSELEKKDKEITENKERFREAAESYIAERDRALKKFEMAEARYTQTLANYDEVSGKLLDAEKEIIKLKLNKPSVGIKSEPFVPPNEIQAYIDTHPAPGEGEYKKPNKKRRLKKTVSILLLVLFLGFIMTYLAAPFMVLPS